MELTLTRHGAQIQVQVDGSDSHAFPENALEFSADDPLATQYDPQPYGARLYGALFPPTSLAARELAGKPDALLLVMEDADLQRVPWEYLFDGKNYLALEMPLTRGLPANQRVTFRADGRDAGNVLVVASDPLLYENGAPVVALNVARERDNVRAAFEKSDAAFRVTFVRPPTLDELQKQLTRQGAPVILHFLGHGKATPQGAQLAFEDKLKQVESADAVQALAPAREKLFCVYFNSCETAMALESTASNLAYTLARAGVPYVLGMQFEVPEMAALRLSEFFYAHLAQGETVERAVWQARRALWRATDLMRVPGQNAKTRQEIWMDLRAYCLGIPVLYSALASPAGIRVSHGAAEIHEIHPRREFDPRIPPPQVFRGRARELVAIGRMLERGYADESAVDAARRRDGRVPEGARVIVLRGEGGMGKSTLARRAAEAFDWRFPDGILGISFEDVPAADALVARLGKWFLNNDAAEQAAVVEAVRTRRALLILDNYETLVHALNASSQQERDKARGLARLLAQLAGGATTLLITTRVAVDGLAGAQEFLIEGLETDAGRALFWDYAARRRRDLDDSIAAEIVERVGGHPLAIELTATAYAASSLSLPDFFNSLQEQLARAEDFYKNERHATLAGCFEYSYQFLNAAAQNLFPKLRLFRAPFLAEFAKHIFETDDAQNILHALWQASFVRALEFGEDTPLYFLHPMAEWFAGERGQRIEKTDERIRQRYSEVYYNLANQTYASFAGKTDVGIVQLARVTVPDLIRAREFLGDEARIRHDRRLGYILQNFGWMKQADELLREGLKLAEQRGDMAAQSSALFEQARLAVTRGDLDGAMRLYQQSAAIDEQLGDLQGKSATLHQMAGVFVTRGDLDGAMRLYQQSAAIDEQLGDLQGKSATLHAMANVMVTRGDLDGAMRLYQQSLQIKEQLGDLQGKSATLAMLAQLLFASGDKRNALAALLESLQTLLQIGAMPDANKVANILYGLKQNVGAEEFARLWREVTGNDEQPEWLRGD